MVRPKYSPYQCIIQGIEEEKHTSTTVITSNSSNVFEIEGAHHYIEKSNTNHNQEHHHGINRASASISISIQANAQKARGLIFISHFIAQFSECAWQFLAVVILAGVSNNQSILLVSSFYLSSYVTVALFGAPFGRFIDMTNRHCVALLCIAIKNTSVLLATVVCFWLLTIAEHQVMQQNIPEEMDKGMQTTQWILHDKLSVALIALVHLFGSLRFLFNRGFEVAIERDWIVVLSQQRSTTDQEAWLSRTNVALRQIFLVCNVISPTFVGWIVSVGHPEEQSRFSELYTATILIGVLSITSLLIESICVVQACNLVPSLGLPPQRTTHIPAPPTIAPDDHDKFENIASVQEPQEVEGTWHDESVSMTEKANETMSFHRSYQVYWQQSIVWAGLSLALIYSNALCFGGAMTTFLLWEGMSIKQVGMWRGLSSAIGLGGTFAYKISTHCTSVVNTGAWGVMYMFGCVTISCASFLVDDNRTSINILVASAAASRIGLWVFDISITLLYQEMVPNGVRGLVGGTQQSLNSCFTMVSGCLGLVFNKPEQFWVIATVGYVCIGIATMLYTAGVCCRSQKILRSPTIQ